MRLYLLPFLFLCISCAETIPFYNGSSVVRIEPPATVISQPLVRNISKKPKFESMQVNGGEIYAVDVFGFTPVLAGQNSIVEQLLVKFDSGVTLDSGAFTIDSVSPVVSIPSLIAPVAAGKNVINVIVEPVLSSLDNTQGGYREYRLRFGEGAYTRSINNAFIPAALGNRFTLIKDGFYKLNISGSQVHAGGRLTGEQGSDSSSPFWALFGCNAPAEMYSGGGDTGVSVSNADLDGLVKTYGSSHEFEGTAYDARYDWDLNGEVSNNDLDMFTKFYGVEWLQED